MRRALIIAIMTASLGATGAHAAAPDDAPAEVGDLPPCDGVSLVGGVVSFPAELRVSEIGGDETRGCLAAAAALLKANPNIRSVTIAARVSGDAAARRTALASAEAAADVLAAHGIPRGRISAVAPGATAENADTLRIAYVERRSGRPVAQVYALGGKVMTGSQRSNLNPAKLGTLLSAQQLLETGLGSVALVQLLDGSRVRVDENTMIRIGELTFERGVERRVRIDVLSGYIEVLASPVRGPLRVKTDNAVAGVRGTHFRVANEDPRTSRVETLDGTVNMAGKLGNVFVAVGEGTRVDFTGHPEEPRPLLMAPRIVGPVLGQARTGDVMAWDGVEQAAMYRVDIAEDAQFTKTYWSYTSTTASTLVSDKLEPGKKWFWRVTPVDRDGFAGLPSKIYAFTVRAG